MSLDDSDVYSQQMCRFIYCSMLNSIGMEKSYMFPEEQNIKGLRHCLRSGSNKVFNGRQKHTKHLWFHQCIFFPFILRNSYIGYYFLMVQHQVEIYLPIT